LDQRVELAVRRRVAELEAAVVRCGDPECADCQLSLATVAAARAALADTVVPQVRTAWWCLLFPAGP
jgi:hypothetical protein